MQRIHSTTLHFSPHSLFTCAAGCRSTGKSAQPKNVVRAAQMPAGRAVPAAMSRNRKVMHRTLQARDQRRLRGFDDLRCGIRWCAHGCGETTALPPVPTRDRGRRRRLPAGASRRGFDDLSRGIAPCAHGNGESSDLLSALTGVCGRRRRLAARTPRCGGLGRGRWRRRHSGCTGAYRCGSCGRD